MPRDLQHFEQLVDLLALERDAQAARFATAREGKTAVELAALGLVLIDLEAIDEAWGLGGRLVVTFATTDKSEIAGKWEPGAVVLVAPARAELTPVRGVVSRRERSRLNVAFDEVPPVFVTAGNVIVFATSDERSFDRAKDAVRAIAALDKGAGAMTRDVLLGKAAARFGAHPPLTKSALNPEQQVAARQALEARDLFLVHGPPGTGKSTVLAEVAVRAVAERKKVLVTAASNAAVDHLLEVVLERGLRGVRIGHPARVARSLIDHSLDEQVQREPDWQVAQELWDQAGELSGYARRQRRQGRSRERHANARAAAGEAKALRQEAREREGRAVAAVLSRSDVVAATLSGLWGYELRKSRFDVALVDEATQAIEPVALGAFARASVVIMAGDHCQLPPTVLSQRAAERGLAVSLFERLLADHGDPIRVMLKEQHRMSTALMAFPSHETYGGELRAHPSVAGRRLTISAPDVGADQGPVPPVIFVDTAGRGFDEDQPPGTESFRNSGEAALVVARAVSLVTAGLSPTDVAVIAPYSAQVTELRARAAAHPELSEVEIDTVDAFQGREKEAVLVSLTRANATGTIGFLADLRRMNVAITRARAHLFVTGDSGTVSREPYYERFIEAARAQGGYRSVWEWPGAAEIVV
jgi:ATP-dependent RNA/DNA helicase IGHMBP2